MAYSTSAPASSSWSSWQLYKAWERGSKGYCLNTRRYGDSLVALVITIRNARATSCTTSHHLAPVHFSSYFSMPFLTCMTVFSACPFALGCIVLIRRCWMPALSRYLWNLPRYSLPRSDLTANGVPYLHTMSS